MYKIQIFKIQKIRLKLSLKKDSSKSEKLFHNQYIKVDINLKKVLLVTNNTT